MLESSFFDMKTGKLEYKSNTLSIKYSPLKKIARMQGIFDARNVAFYQFLRTLVNESS
jgi:hypothetical protein